jgi:hypothetical protein
MTERDPFINWYKERFDKLNESPPEEVWNSISQNLSINEAWKGIDSKLSTRKRRKTIVRRSIYALSLLLLLFISGNLLLNIFGKSIGEKVLTDNGRKLNSVRLATIDNSLKQKIHFTPAVSDKSRKTFGATTLVQSTAISSPTFANQNILKKESMKVVILSPENSLTKNTEDIVVTNPIEPSINLNNENKNADAEIQNNIVNSKKADTNYPDPPFLPMPMFSAQLILEITPPSIALNQITASDSTLITNKSRTDSKFRGWYAGGINSINNVWLLNSETFSGLNNNSLNQTNINAGYAYGISAGYGFHDKWAAELNWCINSHQGQKYHVYEEGRYLSKNVSLNYTAVNLSVRQRKTSRTKWSQLIKSRGIVAGINYGYLKNAKEICGQKTEMTKDNYHSSDFGFRFGYGYEFLAYSKILFSAGIHTDIGLKNIYSGTDFIPANFDRTHNAAIGFQVGLKYLFH